MEAYIQQSCEKFNIKLVYAFSFKCVSLFCLKKYNLFVAIRIKKPKGSHCVLYAITVKIQTSFFYKCVYPLRSDIAVLEGKYIHTLKALKGLSTN